MAGSNAGKRIGTTATPPWHAWTITQRHLRAIRFIETYCVPHQGYRAGEPLTLAPFQKEWLEEVLAPGVEAAVMSLPAGNGKSTLLGAVGVWALYDEDDTGAPSIPVCAVTLKQASETVYGAALAMVEAEPELRNRAKIFSGIATPRIETPHNRGKLFPLSHDPQGLQGYNPSLAIVDEIGFQEMDSWLALRARSGKREHSLVVGIGTPGFDKSKSALWFLRERYRTGVAMPGFHFTEYAADEGCSLADEAQWHKANPALLDGFKNVDAMRSQVAESPEAEFRTYQLGQWVDGVEGWLGVDGRKLWDSLADPYDFLPGAPTWVGIDVALKHDSTAVVAVQKRADEETGEIRLHAKARIWHPVDNGSLDVTDAMHYLRELCNVYDVKTAEYDPRFFDLPGNQLRDEGYPVYEKPQTLERMTPAVGATHDAIKRGELSHDHDSAFAEQVLNAVVKMNQNGFTLSKSKVTRKIDAAIALCIAVHGALAYVEPTPVSIGFLW